MGPKIYVYFIRAGGLANFAFDILDNKYVLKCIDFFRKKYLSGL
jgi:hypothetical protein